jgi:hypothetical protein
VRLEPGQAAVMYVAVHDLIEWARTAQGRRRIVVRGTARLAGRRAQRSRWSKSWRVSAKASGQYPYAQPTPQVEVYRALIEAWPSGDLARLYEAWLDVWSAAERGARGIELADVLEPYMDSVILRVKVGHSLGAILDKPRDAL